MKAIWIASSPLAVAIATLAPAHAQAQAVEGASASENGDIIVTARRREESAQSVPIAITAVAADTLESRRIYDAKGLESMVPSLNVNSGNSREGARYTLRGQGATLAAGESVAVYFAEAPVPQFFSGGPGFYYDLANVQVLNGPQGTLFGRNTTGGAVLFSPRMPEDHAEGYVEAAYGNYDNRELKGAVSVPITDRVKLRLSGLWRKRDGFTYNKYRDNYVDNLNYWSGRAILDVELTDNLTNTTIYSYLRSTSNGTGFVIDKLNLTGPVASVPSLFNTVKAELAARGQQGNRVINADSETFFRIRAHTLVNTTTLELGDITFKNIFSYFKSSIANGFDIDGTPAPLVGYILKPDSGSASAAAHARENYYTNEFQVQGSNDTLDWVLGAYLYKYDPYAVNKIHFVQFGAPYRTEARDSGSSKALFAQASLNLGSLVSGLEGLKLTGGYRYTWDKQRGIANNFRVSDGLCSGTGGRTGVPAVYDPNCRRDLRGTSSEGTYTLGVDWQVSPRTLIYAASRRGYKAGGFNPQTVIGSPFTNFGPELVTDYEIGLKTTQELGATRIRFNVAAFQNDYTDIQRNQTVPVPGSNPPIVTNVVINAASATIKGVEAQMDVDLGNGIAINGFYSYLDSKYDKFLLSGVDLAGVALPYSPRHKFSVSPSFTIPVGDDSEVVMSVTWSHQSSYRSTDVEQPGNIVAGRSLVDASFDWKNISGSNFDLGLYATNLLNKQYISQPLVYYYSVGTVANAYGEPRMYGLRLKYNFGK